jgi:hypothetical protein
MRKKIKKFSKRIANRENITAIGMLVAIAGVVAILMSMVYVFESYNIAKKEKESRHNVYEDEIRELSGITTNLEPVQDITASWKTFENKSYGLSIKYPQDWTVVEQTFDPSGKYLDSVLFSNSKLNGQQESFEIFVYDSEKYSDPAATDNLVKKNSAAMISDCPSFGEITLGESMYPAKEINVTANDPCYKETFFYSLTKDRFTYNLVPHFGSGFDISGYDEKISLVKVFPEFYDVVSTVNISEESTAIQKVFQTPRNIYTAAARPKIRYVAGGTCAHKNDHPSYSDTKGKHMDEDCCPDPDEWPNPRCAYSGGQLGVMKAKPKK